MSRNNQSDNLPFEKLSELIEGSDQFEHLKFIISYFTQRSIEDEYLLVNRDGFEIVKIVDIDYSDNKINIYVESKISGNSKQFCINIYDKSFHMALLNIKDIQNMISMGLNNTSSRDELLDFQF